MKRQRLDEVVVERGLLETRSRARAWIMAGDVLVNGQKVTRAGQPVAANDAVALAEARRFVSRGGDKLDHALSTFDVDLAGKVVADLGASTGGFTDCALQRGALRVYAVDVGYGQLDQRIREDPRVVVMERTNARLLQSLPEQVDVVVIDVSFVSLALILPVAAGLLAPNGRVVALIKPQFEAGPKDVGKHGVVRDPVVHARVLHDVISVALANGFAVDGLTASPLLGPAGNAEFLGLFGQDDDGVPAEIEGMIAQALAEVPSRPRSAPSDPTRTDDQPRDDHGQR